LNDYYYNKSPLRRLKNIVGLKYRRSRDPEYKAIKEADFIISPSHSLKNIVSERWNIDPSKIYHAPNPYFPSEQLQSIPTTSGSENILYIGRLETRKGVYNLARAIPLVLKSFPNSKFTFLGKDSRGPRREKSMLTVLKQIIGESHSNVSFLDYVPLTEVPSIIAKADICVFPSLWENFPNVCLEAMTAGKSIVASKNGGMVDMLQDNKGGVLVDPHEPSDIANGIIQLLSDSNFRNEAGKRNREKAVRYYGGDLTDELVQLYSGFISG
jgi:glycosyltransferase involved in cell wall biosynthesis